MGSKLGDRSGLVVNATQRPPYHWERKNVPIVKEAVWAPRNGRMDEENLTPTGILSPDLPARSESLYRLSNPVPWCAHWTEKKTV